MIILAFRAAPPHHIPRRPPVRTASMTLSPTRLGLAVAAAAAAGALALWQPAASAGQPRSGPSPYADDVIQVLADVVLIESECRQFTVDYGKLFAFAERNGVRPVEIMPLGERRATFDAAYRRRAREAKGDRLCRDLAEERDNTVPGVFLPR